jgi:hypothetical protein
MAISENSADASPAIPIAADSPTDFVAVMLTFIGELAAKAI